jgi:hypothetical protein
VRTDLYLKIEIIKKILIVFSILISFQYGIYGLLWSNVFTSIIALIINTTYSGKMIDYNLKQQLLDMLPTIISSSLMSIGVFFFVIKLQQLSLIIQIIAPLIIGWILYFILNLIINKQIISFILQIIKTKNFQNDSSN